MLASKHCEIAVPFTSGEMRGVVAQKEYAKLSRETTRVNVDDYELSVFFDCED